MNIYTSYQDKANSTIQLTFVVRKYTR